MKTKEVTPKPNPPRPPGRRPHVTAVRRIVPGQSRRVWSLLLPPNFDRK